LQRGKARKSPRALPCSVADRGMAIGGRSTRRTIPAKAQAFAPTRQPHADSLQDPAGMPRLQRARPRLQLARSWLRLTRPWLQLAHVWLRLARLWLQLAHLWLQLAHLWLRLARPWLQLARLWLQLARLWLRLAHLWRQLAHLWLQVARPRMVVAPDRHHVDAGDAARVPVRGNVGPLGLPAGPTSESAHLPHQPRPTAARRRSGSLPGTAGRHPGPRPAIAVPVAGALIDILSRQWSSLRFYAELNDFIAADRRQRDFALAVRRRCPAQATSSRAAACRIPRWR
jgi:hypothetical protein